MNKFESPAMTAQATIRASVLKYTALLCKSLEDNYNRKYTNRAGQLHYSIRTGRKYHKIVEGEGEAHAFVDKNTETIEKTTTKQTRYKNIRRRKH